MVFIVNSGLEKKYLKNKKKIAVDSSSYFSHNSNNDIKLNSFFWNKLKNTEEFSAYIKYLTNKIFPSLCKNLNHLHGINFSQKTWNIIINPWLNSYLESTYFRWKLVESIIKKNKIINLIYFNNLNILPIIDLRESKDNFFYSDYYNQFILQRVWKFFKYKQKKKINFFFKNEYLRNNYDYLNFKKKNKLRLAQIIDFFSAFIFGKQKYFISLNIGKIDYFKLCFKIKTFPLKGIFWFRNQAFFKFYKKKIKNDNNLRNQIKIDYKLKNDFEKFLLEHFNNDIPQILIEKFKEIMLHVKSIPLNPKIIVNDNFYIGSSIFKFWLASKLENESKFIPVDHGGLYGNGKRSLHYEDQISDTVIKWHKPTKSNQVQLPVLHFRNFFNKRNLIQNREKILFISHDGPKYPKLFNTGPLSEQWIDQYNMIKKFYLGLNKNIQNAFFLRPYLFLNNDWWLKKRLIKFFGEKKIIINNTEYFNLIKKSKLTVCAYPKTAFLQSIISGPTILIFDKKFYNETKRNKFFLNNLKKSKIFFDNSKEAYIHINKIWNNLDDWWQSKEVIKTRNIFISEYMSQSENPLEIWSSFLKTKK